MLAHQLGVLAERAQERQEDQQQHRVQRLGEEEQADQRRAGDQDNDRGDRYDGAEAEVEGSCLGEAVVEVCLARAVASGLSGAAESGRLEVLLSAPVSRSRIAAASFAATAVELAIVLALTVILTAFGSLLAGAHLSLSAAIAGYANVWPLALLFAGLGVFATGFSLRTTVVTGAVAGVLVTMYLVDLVGRLDPDLSGIRYASVFKYYGNAIEDGIDPLAFLGVTAAAIVLAALGAWLFERRDLAA